IATDIDGLYTADPRSGPSAAPVNEVNELTPEIMAMAGDAGSAVGTGGMRTKLEAAEKAAAAGIETLLFNGRDSDVVNLLSHDLLHGTRLRAGASRPQARKYWLRHVPASAGAIIRIDEGAARALGAEGASLLPKGIVAALGDFQRGDVVEIVSGEAADQRAIARGISQYGALEINRIAGNHTRDIADSLGYAYSDCVVHRDDMVTLETGARHE
ncbi:MAG: glutamate 5-kinase, partial [Xanthomonadales bacterium]|nr:glutamate 5-kinase [Xanthomonadales bacterium]